MSVVPMYPLWPSVRCDGCGHTYTVPEDRRTGIVTATCPDCGHDRFSTRIGGDVPATILEPDDAA